MLSSLLESSYISSLCSCLPKICKHCHCISSVIAGLTFKHNVSEAHVIVHVLPLVVDVTGVMARGYWVVLYLDRGESRGKEKYQFGS